MTFKVHRRKNALIGVFFFLLLAIILGYTTLCLIEKIIFPMTYYEIVEEEAKNYDIDPLLVMSVIKAESNFDPNATSSRDALGLMQIRPQTAEWCAKRMALTDYSVEQLYDPATNIAIGCHYLRYLLDKYDDNRTLAIAAYNAGEGNVSHWQEDEKYSSDGINLDQIPFKETNIYIEKIEKYYKYYKLIYQRSDS